SSVVGLLRGRPRAVVLAFVAVGMAGCSSEVTRFNDNPYAARPTSGEVTGSIAPSAPSSRVDQAQLPPPVASGPVAAPPEGIAGGGRGMASYQPASTPAPEFTGSVLTPRRPAPTSGQWTWDGGTPVTVAPGDTVDSIAHRHGVPASALMQANNLTAPAVIRPG